MASRPGGTVLVVDDTPDSLRLLVTALEGEGLDVLIATDGEAAIALLEHVTPDLVLMDAVMPGVDGFEATVRIKRDARFARLPIIFMTGLVESEHVLRGFAAGGVDFVTKPIVIDELVARLRAHLANARVAQGSQTALDLTGRPLLALDADDAPLWFTPRADAMLARAAPGWSSQSRLLPAALVQALRRLQPEASLRIDTTAGQLEFTQVSVSGGERLFLLAETDAGEEERTLARRHGLTTREAEVLLWISRGKPNREMSEILGISPRTVNKHLEQIFEKLGVENRASAAAVAVGTLSRWR